MGAASSPRTSMRRGTVTTRRDIFMILHFPGLERPGYSCSVRTGRSLSLAEFTPYSSLLTLYSLLHALCSMLPALTSHIPYPISHITHRRSSSSMAIHAIIRSTFPFLQ